MLTVEICLFFCSRRHHFSVAGRRRRAAAEDEASDLGRSGSVEFVSGRGQFLAPDANRAPGAVTHVRTSRDEGFDRQYRAGVQVGYTRHAHTRTRTNTHAHPPDATARECRTASAAFYWQNRLLCATDSYQKLDPRDLFTMANYLRTLPVAKVERMLHMVVWVNCVRYWAFFFFF